MKKYMTLIIFSAFVGRGYAVVPLEKEVAGKVEDLSVIVPEGESFSNIRSIWLQKAREKCDFKEFKIKYYSERNESYGDGLSLNLATGKYEGEKIPAAVSGMFQCLEVS